MSRNKSDFTDDEAAYFAGGGDVAPPGAEEMPEESDQPSEDLPSESYERDDESDEVEVRDQKGQKTYVPHGALAKERARRKEIEERLARSEQDMRVLAERTNILLQQQGRAQQPQQQRPQLPPADEDPVANINYLRQQAAIYEQRERARDQQQAQYQQAQYREQQVRNAYIASAQKFKNEEKSDFVEAYQHFIKARHEELEDLGYASHQEREQIIRSEEISGAEAMFQRGINPAAALYRAALRRGYRPANGKESGADIDKAKEATRRSATLSSAEGGTPNGKITAETLLRMSPQEFDAFAKKNPRRYKELMGGG